MLGCGKPRAWVEGWRGVVGVCVWIGGGGGGRSQDRKKTFVAKPEKPSYDTHDRREDFFVRQMKVFRRMAVKNVVRQIKIFLRKTKSRFRRKTEETIPAHDRMNTSLYDRRKDCIVRQKKMRRRATGHNTSSQ